MDGAVDRFDCASAADAPERKSCEGKISLPGFGVNIRARTAARSNELTYAMELMASPGAAPNDTDSKAMFGAFLMMALRIVATFNPDAPKEKRYAVVQKLLLGINGDSNEVKLGNWVYTASNRMLVTFTAERADDRRSP